MEEGKLKGYLEVATNIAVLLVALLILGRLAWTYVGERPLPSPHLQLGIRRGDRFSIIPRIHYAERPQTLVIAMSTGCGRCNESLPFLRQVLQASAENAESTQIVAVFPESAEEVIRYVSEQQIGLNAVPGIDYRTLNLPGTPTAVLVSSEGTIINFWIGKPSKDAEREIMDSVKRKG